MTWRGAHDTIGAACCGACDICEGLSGTCDAIGDSLFSICNDGDTASGACSGGLVGLVLAPSYISLDLSPSRRFSSDSMASSNTCFSASSDASSSESAGELRGLSVANRGGLNTKGV